MTGLYLSTHVQYFPLNLASRASWDVYLFKWTGGAVDTQIIQVPGGILSIEKYPGKNRFGNVTGYEGLFTNCIVRPVGQHHKPIFMFREENTTF